VTRNSGTFTKNDSRAAAAARKSRRPKLPKLNVSFMDEIRKMEPEVLQAMKVRLKDNDPAVIRMIIDRLAPMQLATDAEIKDTIKALTDQNNVLAKELEDARAQLSKQNRLAEITANASQIGHTGGSLTAGPSHHRKN
jgi:histidinol phosphatase-like enzyme